MTDIIVSGAGTTAANGTYVDTDIVNGRPRYIYGLLYITWSGTQWQIRGGTKSIYYYSADDVATPDLCTTWTKGAQGSDPVPTVTADSGGAPDELTSTNVSFGTSVSKPTLTETASATALTSKNVSSATSASKVSLAEYLSGTVDETYLLSEQYFGKFYWANNAVPEVADPAGIDDLASKPVTAESSVSKSALAQTHALASKDVTSTSSVDKTTLAGNHALASKPVTAASEVSKLTLAQPNFTLESKPITGASSVSKPTLGQTHALASKDVTGASIVSKPTLVMVVALTSKDITAGSSVSKPSLTSADFLFAEIWDGQVRLVMVVDEQVVLNKEVNEQVVMNREVTDSYSELENI